MRGWLAHDSVVGRAPIWLICASQWPLTSTRREEPALVKAGGFRLDDPAGEAGIEWRTLLQYRLRCNQHDYSLAFNQSPLAVFG